MIGKAAIALGAALLAATAANAHSVTVLGKNADAIACYRAADSEAARPDALADCNRALHEADLDRYDETATYVNRGIVRFRLSDLDGAIADFDEAMALTPGQPDAMINRGIAMLAAGHDVDQSLTWLERGLAAGPQRPWVGYYGRAVANEIAGRDAAAYRDYRRAQELRPTWELPRRALARFTVRS